MFQVLGKSSYCFCVCPEFPGYSCSPYWPPVPRIRSSRPSLAAFCQGYQGTLVYPELSQIPTHCLLSSVDWPEPTLCKKQQTCLGLTCLLEGFPLWKASVLTGIRSIIIENKAFVKIPASVRMVCHDFSLWMSSSSWPFSSVMWEKAPRPPQDSGCLYLPLFFLKPIRHPCRHLLLVPAHHHGSRSSFLYPLSCDVLQESKQAHCPA